ncbi:MAG: hypothetical protein JNL58_01615 [Planctomyces sp.]|nr:hypothetical protein [Planctomyces sp.]
MNNPYNAPNSSDASALNVLQPRLPVAGIIGLVASSAAIGLWLAEAVTRQMVFSLMLIPCKLALLAAPLFFYHDISRLLYQRKRLAFALGMTLITVTVLAAMAYLPFRESFLRRFNTATYYWYSNIPQANAGNFPPGIDAWRNGWNRGVPHFIEATLLVAYYVTIISICCLGRLDRVFSVVVGLGGYAMLLIVPMVTGLIEYDFDIFLRGIVFDSISLNLFPPVVIFWGGHSIFLFVFLLIFFAVCAIFMKTANPQRTTW